VQSGAWVVQLYEAMGESEKASDRHRVVRHVERVQAVWTVVPMSKVIGEGTPLGGEFGRIDDGLP
jgi:hypothetical protein